MTWDSDLLALILQAAGISHVADNASSSPLTSLYLSLHTASPGEVGTQETNECTYSGYARNSLVRSSDGWTISGATASNVLPITFGKCTSGQAYVTHFGLGSTLSGPGVLYYYGTLSLTGTIAQGLTPYIPAGAISLFDGRPPEEDELETVYYGPGNYFNDNNNGLKIRTVDGYRYQVLMSFRAPKSGNLTKFRTYLVAGTGPDNGYSNGTGGTIRCRIWPANGSSPARPVRTGTALSEGQHFMDFTPPNGERDPEDLSQAWPLFTLTPNEALVEGTLYFIELVNVDADPVTNWVSANCSCAVTENTPAIIHSPVQDNCVIWEYTNDSTHTYYDFSTSDPQSNLYFFPKYEYGYSDGSFYGHILLESGNYDTYPFSISSSYTIRERFNIPSSMTVIGVEVHTAASTAGDLTVSFVKNGTTVSTATITESPANYSTTEPNNNGVLEWYTPTLSSTFSVQSGDVLDVVFLAVGSAVWKMSADRTGVDQDMGLSNTAVFYDSSAQVYDAGSWKNTLYYSKTVNYTWCTSHFRVILETLQ